MIRIRLVAIIASTMFLLTISVGARADDQASETSCAVNEGIIQAPVAEVWKVFATGEGFKKLGVAKAEVDLSIGGLIRSHYSPDGVLGDEGTIENQIIAYEPERMLSIRINKPPKGFPFDEAWKHTWTVITLSDLGDGRTHLRISGLGYTSADEDQRMRQFFLNGNGWTIKHLQEKFGVQPQNDDVAAHADDPLATIEHAAIVRAPREDVWKALATAEGWKGFFGVEASIGARPGEPMEIYFGSDAPAGERGSEGCTILAIDEPRLLSFTWNAPPKFAHARGHHTWVVVTLEDLSGGATRVRVRHLGFAKQAAEHPEHAPEWKEVRAYFQRAWGMVMGELQSKVGRREPAAPAPAPRRLVEARPLSVIKHLDCYPTPHARKNKEICRCQHPSSTSRSVARTWRRRRSSTPTFSTGSSRSTAARTC